MSSYFDFHSTYGTGGIGDNPFFDALSVKFVKAGKNFESLIQNVVRHADGTGSHFVVGMELLLWEESYLLARDTFGFYIPQ